MTATIFFVATTTILLVIASSTAAAQHLQPQAVDMRNMTGLIPLRHYGNSSLYRMTVSNTSDGDATYPSYQTSPLLLHLVGSREAVGTAYAALTYKETAATFQTFLNHVVGNNTEHKKLLTDFLDFIWGAWMKPNTPTGFLAELRAMEKYMLANPEQAAACNGDLPHLVSLRMAVLGDLPADEKNLISALVRDIFPPWLKKKSQMDLLISILNKVVRSCDTYAVWGSRTQGSRLYSSRNLDFNSNTGINRYKNVLVLNIDGAHPYSSFQPGMMGLNTIAGMNKAGISTSECNLDNSQTTLKGVPFPLRLRYVLEKAHNLHSAMTVWNETQNTNSFNFLIASSADKGAFALETQFNFTAQFAANSPVEAAATYDCGTPDKYDKTCSKWVQNYPKESHYGKVKIGMPLVDAVWRTNHGMNPHVMLTQEPLFNNTVYRYVLINQLISSFAASSTLIGDREAVQLVATSGIKYKGEGGNFFSCDPNANGRFGGDHVLSVSYQPDVGRAYVAWEYGNGPAWRPAACSPYVLVDFSKLW